MGTMREFLHAKIHNATVTRADVRYVGSITIDGDLLDMVGLTDGEKVLVVSNTSGERLETYVIRGDVGSGEIGMNGACAKRIGVGETVIIMGFELSETPVAPRIVLVDGVNRVVQVLG